MNEMYIQTVKMLIYIVAGIFLNKSGFIAKNVEDNISKFVINIAVPCAILSSFINSDIRIPVAEFFWLISSVVISFFLLSILGKFSSGIICKKKSERGVWEYMMLFSNNIYIGFPVINTLLGNEGLIYAILICIPCNFLIFSYGIYLARVGSKLNFSWKKIINTCTIASILSVLLLYFPVEIPVIAEDLIAVCGKLSTPLALILLGMIISEEFNIEKINIRRSVIFCLLRLIVGAFIIGIEYLLMWKDFVVMRQVMVLTVALPASNLIIILSKQYKNEAVNLAIEGVTISTGAYLVFAPVIQKLLFIFF